MKQTEIVQTIVVLFKIVFIDCIANCRIFVSNTKLT